MNEIYIICRELIEILAAFLAKGIYLRFFHSVKIYAFIRILQSIHWITCYNHSEDIMVNNQINLYIPIFKVKLVHALHQQN